MFLSIIVPLYNVEKYIRKCLDSLLNQNFENYEIIVVNDGSTDNSDSIIRKYYVNNVKIKYFTKENGGLSSARNFGLSKASGEYIMFVDSDDYVDENLLLEMYEKLSKSSKTQVLRINKRVLNSDMQAISEDKVKELYELNGEQAFLFIRRQHIILETAWTYIIKKSYWDSYNFSFAEGYLHEDLGLIPDVIIHAKFVSFVNTHNKYNYIYRENSITSDVSVTNLFKRMNDVMLFYRQKKEINYSFSDRKCQLEYYQYYAESCLGRWYSLPEPIRKQNLNIVKSLGCLNDIKLNSIKNFVKLIIYKYRFWSEKWK